MTQNTFTQLDQQLHSQVLGQTSLVQRLQIALLANGHLLLEGAPGLAKTRAVRVLAESLQCDFKRIQFTPDLLPADITGSDIYRPDTHEFEFRKGPIFNSLILADEINRAPAKVQSALLEAMGERQVTVGGHTYKLSQLFLVIATRNPIEQEGTYPMPEAQLDRFLMHCPIGYSASEYEIEVLRLTRSEDAHTSEPIKPVLKPRDIFAAREQVMQLHISESVERYIVELVRATREPQKWDKSLGETVVLGASPRGAIGLERCARAVAWLQERDYVTPADVQSVAHDVLRHRLILDYRAASRGMDADQLISHLIRLVPLG